MDRNKLIALIVEKTGIKIDPDDPAFVLVELNRISLEEAAEKIAEDLIVAANKFDETTTQNVDTFISVANEALIKFITKTNELKILVDRLNGAPAQIKNEPSSLQLHWLIPVLMFFCGTFFGVLVTIFAQK